MTKDGQDAQVDNDKRDTEATVADTKQNIYVEQKQVEEADQEHMAAQEKSAEQTEQIEQTVSRERTAADNEPLEEVAKKDEQTASKEKSTDSSEAESIGKTGTTPQKLAEEQAATTTVEEIRDREAVASQPTISLDDANANVEVPIIAKDLNQSTTDIELSEADLVMSEPAQPAGDIGQETSSAADPTVQDVEHMLDHINKEDRPQEPERKLDADPAPMMRSTGERIGLSGKKSAELEDPHGVQEVLDELPSWREDSQPLRANYPTTTAYRVAIKKKRYTTVGNTIFLIFSSLLLLTVVGALSIYFAPLVAGPKPNPPTGTVQETQPANKAGAPASLAGAETTAPSANGSILTGYQWIDNGTKHELYIDANHHIQELATSDEQIWRITDLTRRSGAAIANGRALAGFEWQRGNSEQIVYIDAKRHVQQLYASNDGQWDVIDLTRKAQAPLANGTVITGYEWTQGGTKQVVYIDRHGHIQELTSSDGNNWSLSDLTALTKAPPSNGNVITCYQWDRLGSKQVDYIDIKQHVQELSFTGGSWHVSDLNTLVGAPLANGMTLTSYQWRQVGARQIAYLDTNNHIQLLASTSAESWNLVDLTQLVKAPIANGNALVGYEWQQGGRNVLYFIDISHHIQEISDAPGEDWQLADLNQFTLSAPPPNGKALVGYAWARHGSKQVAYIDSTNTLQELTSSSIPGRWDLSSWKHS